MDGMGQALFALSATPYLDNRRKNFCNYYASELREKPKCRVVTLAPLSLNAIDNGAAL